MSENDDSSFEEILKGLEANDGDVESVSIYDPWSAVSATYPAYGEGILTKGLVISEAVTADGRSLSISYPPDIATWEVIGFLQWALTHLQNQMMIHDIACSNEDEEEDEL